MNRWVSAVLLLPFAARAQTTATVDDVVASVAAVVKDRAKAVAIRTAKRQAINSICGKSLVLNKNVTLHLGHDGHCDRQTPTGVQRLPDCKEAKDDAGNSIAADYYFVDTCRLAMDLDVELTDAHLLKTVSQDLVSFAGRVAAGGISGKSAVLLGLPALAGLTYGILELRNNPTGTLQQLADLTLEAANTIHPPDVDLTPLRVIAASSKLRGQVSTLTKALKGGLPAPPGNCAKLLSEELASPVKPDPGAQLSCVLASMQFVQSGAPPNPGSPADADEQAACRTFFAQAQARRRVFQALFQTKNPFFEGEADKNGCSKSVAAGKKTLCEQAQVLLRVDDFLHKAICYAQSDNSRRDIRQFVHLFEEEAASGNQIHTPALQAVTKNNTFTFDDVARTVLDGWKSTRSRTAEVASPDARKPSPTAQPTLVKASSTRRPPSSLKQSFDALEALTPPNADEQRNGAAKPSTERVEAAKTAVLGDAPYAELADGLRLVALSLRAYLRERENFAIWRGLAESCLLGPHGGSAFPAFHSCPAFDWSEREKLAPAVADVRDKVLDLFDSPRLALYNEIYARLGPDGKSVATELIHVAAEIIDMGGMLQPEDAATVTARMVRVLNALSKLLKALSSVPTQTPEDVKNAENANLLSDVLQATSDIMRLAQNRDWVGVAIVAQNTVELTPGVKFPGELQRTFKFTRTLMSMFQAGSVEDAKAIFAAQLESLSSREERWPDFSVDVAALVGARGGVYWARKDDGTYDHAKGLVGLFAPFGVQFACKPVGILVYPLDLGSYLVAESGGTAPTAAAAIRGGLAAYVRPAQYIPLVAGASGDFGPGFGDEKREWRLFGFVALELPLFIIH